MVCSTISNGDNAEPFYIFCAGATVWILYGVKNILSEWHSQWEQIFHEQLYGPSEVI